MSQRPGTRARGHLSRGALLSLLLHVHLLGPLGVVIWVFAGRHEAAREAQRAQEVDVEFKDVTTAELPKDLPPLDPSPADRVEPPKPRAEARKPEPKLAEKAETKPDEKTPDKLLPKPEAEPEPPPPKPEERRAHEKMVDLDNDKEVEPPPDAKYLAQKNNRTDQETRAQDTNLQKEQKGEGVASDRSDRDDPQPGAEKPKIAELEDQKSALGRKAPEVTPHDNPEVAQKAKDEARKSLLALRDPAKRQHELTPETVDLSLPRAADGEVGQQRRPVRGANSDPSRLKNGERVKLALSDRDFEYLFGADAEAERRLAQTQRSTKQGKFARNAARVRAALENFIPEVKPGNQTALNTRAAPFAAYIAKMHRSIHKLWGFGALDDWDDLPSSSPLNNYKLSSTLEMVLNRDGTVEKVTVVRASGYLPFDAAAIDVAFNAGPYPDPPRAIRSANGKIYVHWQFNRDERQCATSGVDYFILDNPPAGADRPAVADAAGEPHEHGGAPHEHGGAPHAHGPAPAAAAPNAAPPASNTTAGDGGLRRLRRFDDKRHAAKMQRLDEEVAMAEEQDAAASGPPPPPPPSAPAPPGPRAADAAARMLAESWFKALASGDGAALAAMSSLPFKTSGKDVTKRSALMAMLNDLAGEEKTAGAAKVELYTTAGLRAAIGKLPANVDDGTGEQLYGLASHGASDALILILAKRAGNWHPIGLVRR